MLHKLLGLICGSFWQSHSRLESCPPALKQAQLHCTVVEDMWVQTGRCNALDSATMFVQGSKKMFTSAARILTT